MNIAGKIRKTSGNRIFTGAFWARSSITCLLPGADLDRLVAQDHPDRDAELVALHHRPDERAHRRGVAAFEPVLERLERRETEALLLDRQPDLVAERARQALGGEPEGGGERDAGLERDDEQVDQPRKARGRSLEPLARAAVDDDVRADPAEHEPRTASDQEQPRPDAPSRAKSQTRRSARGSQRARDSRGTAARRR